MAEQEAPPVRVIMLEDQDDDAVLIERELTKAGVRYQARRAVDRPTFESAVREFKPDLILSDYSLVGFSGIEALQHVRAAAASVPFIFVSGTIGEERAIEAMQNGATDYVIKDRLARLVPVVQRALREQAERRERKELEREYLQAQKMESLGRMAAAIAHDFNNVLTVTCGNAELLAHPGQDRTTIDRLLVSILKAGEQGRELTSRLLQFSRGQDGDSTLFDLNARIAAFMPVFTSLVGGRITLRVEYANEPLRLSGIPGQVDQVMMNLLVNARDAMPGGGQVTITTARIAIAEGASSGFPLAGTGEYACLGVRDTGTGMPPEVRARIFEPFFTTKGPGRGTGLGLSTVYAVARQFGGGVAVESEPGHGTVFRIVFRLAEPGNQSGQDRAMVLLVDDEVSVRSYSQSILESAGYGVVTSTDAHQALKLFQQDPGRYTALVCDIMMPELNGIELARRVRAIRVDLPVIFLSGLPAALSRAVVEIEGAVILDKPFRPRDLLAKLRALKS